MRRRTALAIALPIAALLWGCVSTSPPPLSTTPAATGPSAKLTLAPVKFADLPGWNEDRIAEAIPPLLKSCVRRLAQPETAEVGPKGVAGKVADWRKPCDAAAQVKPGDDKAARAYFQSWFRPYRAGDNGETQGLFTGYYEAMLNGARAKGGVYETPLLRRPSDLVMVDLGQFRPAWRGERIAGRVASGKLLPYPNRAEIERGALDSSKLALFWVADPVDAFFLEVQGSGKIKLPDGGLVNVGYDGQNGQPYVAIGKKLVEREAIPKDQVSMQSIKAWIRAHPAEGKALMDENPSYVFFREVKGEAPIGSEGAVLTAGRSLAVDNTILPLGIPVWLDAQDGGETLRRLVIAQDTGGAIRGAVRGDLYWGFGPEAEHRAGGMKARGGYFLLLPKDVGATPTS